MKLEQTLLSGLAFLGCCLPALSAYGQWQPPIGIPTPSFGIVDAPSVTPPARPSPWICGTGSGTPGFYYVDRTHSAATDTSNQYGCPDKPRRTIPSELSAGSYVELSGVYALDHTSGRRLELHGTADRPVWIKGADAPNRPVVVRNWEITNSTYFIVDGIEFADDPDDLSNSSSNTGRLDLYGEVSGTSSPVSYGVIRNSEFSGNLEFGGFGLGAGLSHDIVIWNNYVHDNGNINDTGDQDVHGITVGGRGNKYNIWVVDNEMSYNSGDGLQINGGTDSLNGAAGTSAVTASSTHHIYVGRNFSHHNKQDGVWTKQAQDVIFSENLLANHRPSSSASGACGGYQYGPDRVWFIANHIHSCDYGIQGQSASDLGFEAPAVYVIGNTIHDIHWSDSRSSQAGYMYRSGDGPRIIVNNTFYDVDKAIDSQNASGGTTRIVNNLIANVAAVGSTENQAIIISNSSLGSSAILRNNLFSGSFRVTLGGSSYTTVNALNNGSTRTDNIAAAHGLVGPDSENFHIANGAPGTDTGVLDAVYQEFLMRYGIDIRKDMEGTPRPYGAGWDIGADEAGPQSGTVKIPLAPANLVTLQ